MDESSVTGCRQHTSSRHLLPCSRPSELSAKGMTPAAFYKHVFTDYIITVYPSVFCCCLLGDRKGIRPVKRLTTNPKSFLGTGLTWSNLTWRKVGWFNKSRVCFGVIKITVLIIL